MEESESIQRQLDKARQALQILEQQAAGFGPLHVPVHVQLELEEKRKEIARLEARRKALLADTRCPYRGLEPFEAQHAEFYFGRGEMLERLVAKVRECSFVAVVGPSGCGKSSLVRAGLATVLRQGALPGGEVLWPQARGDAAIFRPGRDPLRSLAAPLVTWLEPAASEVERMAEARKLADHLREGTLPMADVVAGLREKQPDIAPLVLVADQFEELYTGRQDETLRRAFVETLLAAAQEGIKVILTLRADFYGRALADPRLGKAVDAGLVNVLPMSEEELRAAVERPARKMSREFEPGLVDRILQDVAGEPGNLPLLEFALTEMWRRQTAEGVLTHAAYEAIGQVEGAIARRAEAEYGRLEEEEKRLARQVFLRLVVPGVETQDTRRRATLAELKTSEVSEDFGSLERVVKTLAGARLVTTGRDEATGQETVEVAHEALIRGWQRLRAWVDEDREFLTWRQRLEAERREWQRLGRDEGALLRGGRLAEAERWLVERSDDLNPDEQGYTQQSVALREREAAEKEAQRQRELEAARKLAEEAEARRRAEAQRAQEAEAREQEQAKAATRLRRRAMLLAGMGLVAVTLAIVALVLLQTANRARETAERESRISHAREILAFAEAQSNLNAECSLTLALNAYDLAHEIPGIDLFSFENTLRRALAQSRVRTTLEGFPGQATSVDWNPDGKTIASAGSDLTVILDASTGEKVLRLPVNLSWSVAWSPNGQKLAIGLLDGTVEVWDTKTNASVMTLSGHTQSVVRIAWSPDGNQLATASFDGTVRLWDVATGTYISIDDESGSLSVSWSPEGQQIATAPADRTVRLWNALTGESVAVLTGHTAMVLDVAWSPDGRWLASGSDNGPIHLWDLQNLESVAILAGHTNQVHRVAWSPDGQLLASASWDGTIRLWDFKTRSSIATLTGHTSGLFDVAWSPDGQQLVSVSQDRTIRLWNVNQSKSPVVLYKDNGWMWDAAWSPGGRFVASASDDNTIRLWDSRTGENTKNLVGHLAPVTRVAWSPDEQRLASASVDGTVRIWNVSTREQIHVLPHLKETFDVAWSPDGEQLASTSPYLGMALIWDTQTGELILALEGIDSVSIAWSPDGKLLAFASATSGEVRLLNMDTEEADTLDLIGHAARAAIWDLAWSPDGELLASASDDDTVRVWDCKTGKTIVVLTGHTSDIKGVAWSPDGKQLATGSLDKTIRLWNIESGKNVAILTGHTSGVRSVSWNPDGRQLVSAAEDGTVRLFFTQIEDLLPIARQQVAHGLTLAEREVCLGRPLPALRGEGR